MDTDYKSALQPLMPIIRSAKTGKAYPDTRQGREQMDRDDGRLRIPNSGLEAVIVLYAAEKIADRASQTVAPFVRKTGAGKMLRAHIGGIRKSLRDMMDRISTAQNLSIEHNARLSDITVTSHRMPAMINVSIDDMLSICDQALRMCELSCECSREQSKACPLRRALDTIPCEMGSGAWDDAGKCPYRGLRVVWEEVLGDECDAGEAQAAQGC